MRRPKCFKLVIGCLLLFLQVCAFAQSDTTVITDTDSLDMSSVVYGAEEQTQPVVAAPDTPSFRGVPDSVIKAMQGKREFAYANDPAYWVKEEPKSSRWLEWLLTRQWLRYLVFSIMAALLLFTIVKIALSNRLFVVRKSNKKSGNTEEQELLEKDNLPMLIRQAEERNDLRLAVRYWYMKTLQDMDQRKLILLNAQSTNWDYVNKLGSHPLKKQFLLLTRAYEYVWYGEFNINAEQYGFVKTEFQQFENSLGG